MTLLLALGLLAVVASSTHALHMPEFLLGMGMHHDPAQVERTTAPSGSSIAFVAAELSMDEIWCSVEAVQPTLAALVLALIATWFLGGDGLLIEHAWSPGRRTRPPPVVGARPRAALQVYRN